MHNIYEYIFVYFYLCIIKCEILYGAHNMSNILNIVHISHIKYLNMYNILHLIIDNVEKY